MTAAWAILIVILLVVEIVMSGLTMICFAAGALVALAAAFLDVPVLLQIVLFIVVALAAIIITRPLIKKHEGKVEEPLPELSPIGEMARVTECIDGAAGIGTVSFGGRIWRASSANGGIIEEGVAVKVISVAGAKLVVLMRSQEELPDSERQ